MDLDTDRLQALLDSPPSDSQGDQERCGTCGGNRWLNDPLYTSRTPCPDCNPAPKTRKFCPRHGEVDQVGIYCNQPMGRRLACGEELRVEQPEGGDKESFTEVDADELQEASRAPETKALHDAADQHLKTLREEGRIPATSQDSSGLLSEADMEEALAQGTRLAERIREAEDRASKAEAERDKNREDALANLDALEKHRQARVRAETALEELAEKFDECARYAERRWPPIGDTSAGSRIRGEQEAFDSALAWTREKAAKLKEGGS